MLQDYKKEIGTKRLNILLNYIDRHIITYQTRLNRLFHIDNIYRCGELTFKFSPNTATCTFKDIELPIVVGSLLIDLFNEY